MFVGAGNSTLTAAALLSNAGFKVCILEAHDIPGGYAQNFTRGEYTFNAQIHYIWGCAPGGKIYEFLKKVGLEKDIEFELYDPEGYDVMRMPDGQNIRFPYGWDKLIENISAAYPEDREGVTKFVKLMDRIRNEMRHVPDVGSPKWKYALAGPKVMAIVRNRNKTVQQVMDECGISIKGQSVLTANMGDFMSPPRDLSFIIYIALVGGYNTGTYYPKKHFKYQIGRIAESITAHEGCHMYFEMPVTKVNIENNRAVSVETQDGKTFAGKKGIIWNGDPQLAAKYIIGMDKFPTWYQKKLDYEYCKAGIMIYLGIKDLDLTKYGFGKYNIWHLEDWDMNANYDKQDAGNFEKPWIFISTPTLHSNEPGTTPEGVHIMEIATNTSYHAFAEAAKRDKKEYMRMKNELAEKLIDLIEARYIPEIRQHISMKVVGSSVTNEDYVRVPFGSAYGAAMTPAQSGLNRLQQKTPIDNFYFCNATAGYPGMYGTVSTGMQLYMDLTGDYFFKGSEAPTDDEAVRRAWEQFAK